MKLVEEGEQGFEAAGKRNPSAINVRQDVIARTGDGLGKLLFQHAQQQAVLSRELVARGALGEARKMLLDITELVSRPRVIPGLTAVKQEGVYLTERLCSNCIAEFF